MIFVDTGAWFAAFVPNDPDHAAADAWLARNTEPLVKFKVKATHHMNVAEHWVMDIPDFLTKTTEGEILLKGHRIGLFHVVRYYNEGYSPEMLAGQYPTLPLALIHKVIAFYLENRDQVDGYVAGCQTQLDQQRESSGRILDASALRERLTAQQAAETTSDT